MKESRSIVSTDASIVDSNGVLTPIRVSTETNYRYYNIKNINFKGNIMDLFDYQEKLCRSSRDIGIFKNILDSVDKYNCFRKNVSKFAVQISADRSRIAKMLKESVDIGFMKRIDRGVYEVNPYCFKSKGLTNSGLEELQAEWKDNK